MKANPYEIPWPSTRPILGRERELQIVFDRLFRNHVSVIAPRLFGKTALLREVARQAKERGFAQCLAWDLRHHTPRNDEEFYVTLCREIERQVNVPEQNLSEWFREIGTTFEAIKGVFQELEHKGQQVLIVLDGMDGILHGGALTQNVFDNLRDLADLTCVRFLTASRSHLRQLCPPDTKTSPFWGIFLPPPFRFCAFQSADWPGVLQPLLNKRITVDESGQKEILNWTGGIPVLTMAVCGTIFARFDQGQVVAKADVDVAAQQVARDYRDHIEMLWDDLPTEARLDVLDLANYKELSRAGRSSDRIELLTSRGLAVEAGGNKLKPGCRLMEQFALHRGQSLHEVKRLFSAVPDYERSIPEVLQLRLAHLKGFNTEVELRLIELLKAIPKPETGKCLIRDIADCCLDLLLDCEFPGGRIEDALVTDWEANHKLRDDDPKDREILNRKVPNSRGPKMKLLSLLHDENTAGIAKTRRSTFILLQAVFQAGAYGQHVADIREVVPRSFVTAISHVAVELLHQIREDIGLQPAS